MTATAFLLYEITVDEIAKLPFGFTVLQHDSLYNNCYRTLQKGVDKFSADTDRFTYYLFQTPPLELKSDYQLAGVTNGNRVV